MEKWSGQPKVDIMISKHTVDDLELVDSFAVLPGAPCFQINSQSFPIDMSNYASRFSSDSVTVRVKIVLTVQKSARLFNGGPQGDSSGKLYPLAPGRCSRLKLMIHQKRKMVLINVLNIISISFVS